MNLAQKSHSYLRHVVVVKGNPKCLDDPAIKPLADKFYADIQKRLEEIGCVVTFDAGETMTIPDITAYAWVAHSRGIDRLDFAPNNVRTIALETKSGFRDLSTIKDRNSCGKDPKHYQLSSVDISNINALKG